MWEAATGFESRRGGVCLAPVLPPRSGAGVYCSAAHCAVASCSVSHASLAPSHFGFLASNNPLPVLGAHLQRLNSSPVCPGCVFFHSATAHSVGSSRARTIFVPISPKAASAVQCCHAVGIMAHDAHLLCSQLVVPAWLQRHPSVGMLLPSMGSAGTTVPL